ncbi:MAG: hypothetical protein H0A76_12445 [Candidatus Thiodubiliella endoseptemdiera]|uniref:Uncharacterized protein n=1 Tax=Candidatus Thiodubiliella endoseptemdiera TaxID=2738886 RepID=A0A853F501_9GAMM|nr:hypothetical protein [Candidatus Thiodubiliella endoseptemdiera]
MRLISSQKNKHERWRLDRKLKKSFQKRVLRVRNGENIKCWSMIKTIVFRRENREKKFLEKTFSRKEKEKNYQRKKGKKNSNNRK